MTNNLYKTIEQYMLSCAGDSAHDAEHIYRVLYNSLAIAKTETTVDYDILITACLLHDIGRPDQFANPKLCHAQVGADKAKVFLENLGMSPAFIESVCHCIRTHRFSNRLQPETLEAKILFDADKLDVTGALGIARTLEYQGKHDYPLYTVIDGHISDGADDTAPSFFQEYKRKLEKLYDGFYTREGKRLAVSKQTAAETFYHALYQEITQGYHAGRETLSSLLEE